MKAFIFAVAFDAIGDELNVLPFPEVEDKSKPFVVNVVASSLEEALSYCRRFDGKILGVQQAANCIVCGTIADFE